MKNIQNVHRTIYQEQCAHLHLHVVNVWAWLQVRLASGWTVIQTSWAVCYRWSYKVWETVKWAQRPQWPSKTSHENLLITSVHSSHKSFLLVRYGDSVKELSFSWRSAAPFHEAPILAPIFLYFSASFVTRELIFVSNESYILLLYKYTHGFKIHMIGIRGLRKVLASGGK